MNLNDADPTSSNETREAEKENKFAEQKFNGTNEIPGIARTLFTAYDDRLKLLPIKLSGK